MERREKLEFIIDQMRLLRVRENWDMLFIVSKKVNSKWLEDADYEDLKFRFYGLMIQYSLHTDKYLEIAKYYHALYLSPSISPKSAAAAAAAKSATSTTGDAAAKKDEKKKEEESKDSTTTKMDSEATSTSASAESSSEGKWQPLLRNVIFFIVLSPYDNEQSDLLHRILADEVDRLSLLPDCQNLAKCFTTPELTRWPRIESLYGPGLRQTKVFGPDGTAAIDDGDVEQELNAGQGEKRFEELHNRVVEHNIRTIARYYTRIRLERLAQLLDLKNDETEKALAKMVVGKTVHAKIDRPAGLVDFEERNKGTYKVLNEWSRDVGKLMVSWRNFFVDTSALRSNQIARVEFLLTSLLNSFS